MSEEKTEAQLLEEKLSLNKKSCYKDFAGQVEGEIDGYLDGYMRFIDAAKTEREFTARAVERLKKDGFVAFDHQKSYAAGDKIYYNNRGRGLIAAVIGRRPVEDGLRLVAAHIDNPRLDLKPNPLYEDNELGFFKTHYYGGIKKYQWVAIPLALHGVVVKKDGTTVEIVVGEDEGDPVFCITDLLPHLSRQTQDKRTAPEVIKGEELNLLIGSAPVEDEKIKEKVKLNLLKLLNERYGICENDFHSADLAAVPAFKARYIGFDKSLVGAYGHDDRVCAYTALTALLAADQPEYTAVCVLADKEEIGSTGNTGLDSDFLRNFISLLCRGGHALPEITCRNSKCLSADVDAAFDPTFPEVMERLNSAHLNYGPVVNKYTGRGGKYETSEASAEFMAEIRALFDEAGVPWQTGELGKIDEGGGGTVAVFVAALGIEVVDVGVALLSMHAPLEIASSLDIMATYKAFCAFLK